MKKTKEDALNQMEYQLLLNATSKMDDYYQLQTKFILFTAGRLGLRRGEISHMKEEWMDWREKMIKIPSYSDCNCGSCKQHAVQQMNYDNNDHDINYYMNNKWAPKTKSAVRSVPFDFDPRIVLVLENFFDKYDEYPHSSQSINRRLNKCQKLSDLNKNIYPHCLRATAASYHAGRGLRVIPL